MRAFLLLCVVTAFVWPRAVRADAGDQFFAAYFLIQQGDAAEANADGATAHAKYSAALGILNEIKSQAPDWHPDLIAFRTKYCTDHLAALPVQAPARAVPVAEAPAPPREPDQVQQLQTELQKSHAAVKQLEEERDKLATELQTRLREPAPTDRDAVKQTLVQLHELQAANAAVNAKLAAAETKAVHADQLSAELEQSRQKIQELEAGRDSLNGQLQAALAKVTAAQSSPQIEDLLKKNAEMTTRLAGAQAEITKLHEQVVAAPAAPRAEAIQLRAELTQAQGENARLSALQDALVAKLAESDRQWRAAKASNEKSDQIIQQLRKENALLKQLAAQPGTAPELQAKKKAESGGFLWFRPKAKPAPMSPTNAVASTESDAGKLTVAVTAPTSSAAARTEAEEVKSAAAGATEGSPEVRLLLAQARAAMAQKDFATAKTDLTTAAAQEPGNLTVLMNLGITLYRLGQLDEAEDTLQHIVSLAPNQSAARSLLGIIDLRRGRTEDAYEELTRAVAIDPRNAEAYNYLGIVMNQKGWARAAEEEIRRALELNPNYADAHFNLAVLYSHQTTPRLELARYHYQKATELGAARDPQLEAILKQTDAPTK